ncbi:MAG: T9SS type A sorting domain-containing protein [Bacteroidota bacterium]
MKNFFQKFAKALSITVLLFVASLLNAATYTVTSTANGTTTDGVSLRWAITQANLAVGNIIAFNISGIAPHTITLTSALPVISRDNITIDGSIQPGNGYAGPGPKIIINGNNAISKGIEASSTKDGIKIYGLYIKGFTDYGIYFPGKEAHIIGATGKGNVISGNGNTNTDAAIYVKGATIKANIIGMNINGTVAEANTGYGIQATGGLVIIGGGTQGSGNLISANTNHGIFLNNCDNSIIKGNKIGTDITGTLRFGNEEGSGIYMISGSNNVTIGGVTTGEGNLISGNGGDGIYNADGNNAVIKGNKIGTDITGTQNIGNTGNGIYMTATANTCTIGGNGSGEGNIISGNSSSGIYLNGPDFTIIKGNKIGVGIAGENIGNNAYGIYITNSSHDNQVGGTSSAGDANTIAYNGNSGVAVDAGGGGTTDANKIQRNSIFCNASTSAGNSLGIQLIANGNDGLPAPVITSANATTISGTSVPNATIELFQDNDGCVGYQGKTYLVTTTANGSGNWTITGTFPVDVTATQTTNDGTSPFDRSPNLPPDPTSVICNFIKNPDLEMGQNKVTAAGQISFATFWDKGSSTNTCTTCSPASPDLFDKNSNTCTNPLAGNYCIPMNKWTGTGSLNDPSGLTRYAGIQMFTSQGSSGARYFDERIRGELTELLKAGCYNMCFKMAGTAIIGVDNSLSIVEVWLTSSSGPTRFLGVSPSAIALSWQPVCVDFTITAAQAGIYDHIEFRLKRPAFSGIEILTAVFLDDFSLVTLTVDAGEDKIACEGQNTVIGSPTCPFPDATYSWSPGGLTGITVTVNPTVNTTYIVTATTPNGCTVTDEVVVTVAPLPIINVVFPTICVGECATISPTVTGGTTPYSYSWSNGETTSSITVCPGVTANYTVSVTGSNGCIATDIVTVTVGSPPTLDSEPGVACSGSCATASATASGGIPPYTYLWSTGQTGSSINVCPPSTTQYTVTVTDAGGCTASVLSFVDVIQTVLNIGPDKTICLGESVIITNNNSQTYSWQPSTSLMFSGSMDEIVTANPTVTTTYTVTESLPFGCVASDQVTVFVNPSPTVSVADETICSGSCATVTANVSGGTAPYTYLWNTGQTASTVSVCPAATSDYTVTVTDAGGCTKTRDVEVEVLDAPTLSIYTVTNAGCSATIKGTFSADEDNINGGNNPYTYLWSTGETTLNVTGLDVGTYTLTITDNNGCTANHIITIQQETNCPTNIVDPLLIFNDCEILIDCDIFQSFSPTQTYFQIDIYPVISGPNGSVPFTLPCSSSYNAVEGPSLFTASHFTPNLFVNDEDLVNVNDALPLCGNFINLIDVLNIGNLPEFDPPASFFLKGATYHFKFLIRDDAGGTPVWIEKFVCLEIPNNPDDCFDYRDGTEPAIKKNTNDPTVIQNNSNIPSPENNITGYKSIDNRKEELTVNIFPNPANDIFTLNLNGLAKNITVALYDITGRKIVEQSGIAVNGTKQMMMNISECDSGVYYLKTSFNNETILVNKIVLQK